MTGSHKAPFGSWRSPITSDLVVADAIDLSHGLGQVALDGDDVYWIEGRPTEGGRNVIVRRQENGADVTDATPAPWSARTRTHEYGGGDFAVADGTLYFANEADQRLYRRDPGARPRPLTPAVDRRYADAVIDRPRQRLVCVCEDHTVAGREPVNALISLDLEGRETARALVSGNDFYASPRISPDGTRLAWLTWNHPNMPWQGTELWVGEIAGDGSVQGVERVAGDDDESIFQPEWSPDGVLHFVSDRTGWWNLYRRRDRRTEPLCEMAAEFGVPQWCLGESTYAFESAGRIICTYSQHGTWHLAAIDTAAAELHRIETPYSEIAHLRAAPGRAVFRAGSPTEPLSIVQLDLSGRRAAVLRRSSAAAIDTGYVSLPSAIEFPTEGGLSVHAFFYAPRNRDYAGAPGERPPLLVLSHGGPTATASTALDLRIQFWTSRGFAVLDVNYRGSTGYGRAYRQQLDGQWGIADAHDCISGARFLVDRGEVDGNRLAIRGGSAGGYTTLCALTFHELFRAGACYYGISDLEALAAHTHKFESHYTDRLVAPYPAGRALYRQRSPIHHVDRLSCPLILFHGLEDTVVPPSQAALMVEALRAKRLPVAYVAFAGEQHGFRRAENIKRSLESELYFYSRVFGFEPADPVAPLPIENLSGRTG